ncbi:SDR family oxidoreductase [Dactylosporangium sp. NPDC049525]|uniref:SDR family oxidoreductase n=1 Tax=Dactylosporangium sp. NPDC049525 TaxID=3154730 RepID=UPI00342D3EAB
MDQITIVTGGSRGIGAATALRLAGDGHRVAVGYQHNADAATAVVTSIEAAGGTAVAVQVDTTAEDDVVRLFATAAGALGPVTGLVNNAGTTSRIGAFADLDAADLRRVVDVNIVGAFLCAREAARVLPRGGAVVNVSSGAATLGSPGEYIHYAATKAALDTLTIGLSKELGPAGIRVNGVAPGIIRTDIHAVSGDPDRADRIGTATPLGRPGNPSEVAEAIAWLLSSAASYVTGTTLRVAGGR